MRDDGLVRQERPQLIRAAIDVAIVLGPNEESDIMIRTGPHELETIRLAVTHVNHPRAGRRSPYRDHGVGPNIRLLRASQPLSPCFPLRHLDPLGPLMVDGRFPSAALSTYSSTE